MEFMDFKKRSDIHAARKIWHMLTVCTMAAVYILAPFYVSMIILSICIIAFIPLDIMRQSNPKLNDVLVHMFKPIIRQSEVHKLAGTTFLLMGVTIVGVFFPRPVTSLTLLFLAFADPIASYVGICYGKDKILGDKSLQGTLAAFLVCTLLTFIYLYYNNLMVDHLIPVSLLAGLAGALSELVPIGKLDDNLTLPVLSALSLWVIFSLFGGLTGF